MNFIGMKFSNINDMEVVIENKKFRVVRDGALFIVQEKINVLGIFSFWKKIVTNYTKELAILNFEKLSEYEMA